MEERGQQLMQECERLVVECLKHHSAGATNQQVLDETGLYLDVPSHKGYVSWTILENLVARGIAEKVSDGKRRGGVYRLRASSSAAV